tara:strand:+ start:177 stop:716 length:540 start_codon:yes stop_codon:yes gene_type:complete
MILFRKIILSVIFPILMAFSLDAQNRSLNGDSRKFKLTPVEKAESTIGPTMDGGRLGVDRLIDGKLPDSGWRSTWTVWMKKNPSITFNLGAEKRIGIIRVYFQPWDRSDELLELKVEISRDGENFMMFNEYEGFVAEKGKAAWAQVDLRAVKAQYFRLTPQYQGWGNQWGEVEFWEIRK